MVSICESFPKLVMLDVSNCINITPECLILISEKLTELEQLDISNTATLDSEKSNEFLFKLQQNCTNLKVLTVSREQICLGDGLFTQVRKNIKLILV